MAEKKTEQAPEAVKSTQQLDLEARQAEDYVSPLAVAKTVGPNESLISEDGFVGVDPIYQNAANETEMPLASEEGAEKVLEDRVLTQVEDAAKAEEEKQKEQEQEEPAKAAAPLAAPAPTTKQSNS